ncbi:MAG: UPF0104 family protein [Xanthobacteraceae bacterium]|nr:UPF0104 family protein [Xanthobacteraceae bacterium]MBX3533777.1 UPF0104 family protein [Xanthobacteraceae bacterium]MBX3549304.1 UPF0104 family protein [Xanthobacteraceae bacterium]MCW5673616.1 UPF0104 family protein [Xanthobacteraceae bacterium]MCW5678354.1 UPF0104 family protein [Xanthobacteraceae bacterium]
MPKFLKNLSDWFEKHIGLHRIGIAVGVTVFAIAAFVLYRILRKISIAEVGHAISSVTWTQLALAAFFVALAYLTLTFYDYFALKTIGREEVPYHIAAVGGFTSYSIGHNVGFTAFSGGAVRYRIYSASSGLSAVEVAKLCFIAGLTFWLGNIAVLGLGMTIHPEAASMVDQLPPAVNRVIGIGLLTALAVYTYYVSVKPRVIGRSNWSVTLPAGRLTILQILIGIVDLTCCSLAMYVLMPVSPKLDFISLAVIFVSSTLLGFASHSPGGLGVFDAAMLIALPQFAPEQLLASLLLFRLFYFIAPFAISLVIIVIREFVLDIKPPAQEMPPPREVNASHVVAKIAEARKEDASKAGKVRKSASAKTSVKKAAKPKSAKRKSK